MPRTSRPPTFGALIEALGDHGVTAINVPRQIACGAPDFIVVRGTLSTATPVTESADAV